jgi:uncharacterized 2Fe-2S/4Fe-4S cluster protein (DUF4445 family)
MKSNEKNGDAGWVHTVSMNPPSLRDNTADADRLKRALQRRLNTEEPIEIGLGLLRRLPSILRESGYRVRCVLFRHRHRWSLVDAQAASDPRPFLGLAVDLGTSRVVLRLLDLSSGDIRAETAFDNPQSAVGPDILARIHAADAPEGLRSLRQRIVDGLNHAVGRLCRDCRTQTDSVVLTVLSGNTAMGHLFLGLPPRWIIREPYIPVVNAPDAFSAAELGLDLNPGACVMVFPNVGSYFGGDLIAGILFAGLDQKEETSLLVDVGTNAEVVIGNRNWMIACAGAAGPALEGGVTRMGMMAGPGAIDRVELDSAAGDIATRTIGGGKPKGICGSGLIDLAAQLFLSGRIDIRGKFVAERCGRRLQTTDGGLGFELVSSAESADGAALIIDQAELDSLIRSKAAMYTILETLTTTVGVDLHEIDTFYVAGTFGSFIDPRSAIAIGMIPDLPLERFHSLGNSSLEGATLALKDPSVQERIEAVRDRITYLELNVNQDFMNRFSAARFLPHTETDRFPSVVERLHR